MIRRLLCRLGAHKWNRPVVFQMPTVRIVGRVCTRCDQPRHTVANVWSEPVRDAMLVDRGVA